MIGHKAKNKHLRRVGSSFQISVACLTWLASDWCKKKKKKEKAVIQSTGFTRLIIKLNGDWLCVFNMRLSFVVIGCSGYQSFNSTPHSVTCRCTGTWRFGGDVFHDSQGFWFISFCREWNNVKAHEPNMIGRERWSLLLSVWTTDH